MRPHSSPAVVAPPPPPLPLVVAGRAGGLAGVGHRTALAWTASSAGLTDAVALHVYICILDQQRFVIIIPLLSRRTGRRCSGCCAENRCGLPAGDDG
jgi:hypothetical protein